MEFVKELNKLGLKDKEAAVYLACLELGPAPVQQVARKAQVVRATTYVVLETLMKKGLVTRFREGKKTLFAAEPPGQLMRLVEKQLDTIREKEHRLRTVLPELQILTKGTEGRPSVRYFDGIEGLHAIRREMLMYSKPGDVWYNFSPIEYLDSTFAEQKYSYYRQRVGKKIKMMTIYSSKSPERRSRLLSPEIKDAMTERRYVPWDRFPFKSGMTIFRNRIAIGSFTGKIGGVIVESQEMADMMRRLFELAWAGAEAVDKS